MLYAGYSRLDVTPPLGTPLAGYFGKRPSEGILDPIEICALAFGNGQQTAIIIAADFIGMMMPEANRFSKNSAKATGVDYTNIAICCLHQHTSVRIGDKLGEKDNASFEDPAYMDILARKFCDASVMAIKDMSECKVLAGAQRVSKDIGFVRRYFLDDGSVVTNPQTDVQTPVRRCDEADNTARLVRFQRDGKKDIAYVNFSTHPDVVHGRLFSADWPGFVRRHVEKDNEDVLCICVNGCQGDSNHVDYLSPKELRGNGSAHSKLMGRVIADTVHNVWDKLEPIVDEEIFAGEDVVFNKTNSEGFEKYDECRAFIDAYEAGKLDYKPHITELAYAKRVIRLRTSPIYRQVPVNVIGLGNLLFAGFGGEPFTHYGEVVRSLAGDRFVLCSCCTNGYEGYLPHKRAFDEGGYETASSFFTPVLENEIKDAFSKLINK